MILNHKIKIIIHIYHQLLAYSDAINYVITKLKATKAYKLFHSKAVSTLHSSSSPPNHTLFTFSINSFSKLLSLNLFLLDVLINPAILKSRSTGADKGSALLGPYTSETDAEQLESSAA